jgi:hypothetical protein
MAEAKIRIPVDLSGGRVTLITTGAEQRVKDRATGELNKDPETGETLYRAWVAVLEAGRVQPQVWGIGVVGDPGDMPLGQPVRVTNLWASPWEMPDKQNPGKTVTGMSFRADKVELLNPPSRPALGADQKAPANGVKDPVKS